MIFYCADVDVVFDESILYRSQKLADADPIGTLELYSGETMNIKTYKIL